MRIHNVTRVAMTAPKASLIRASLIGRRSSGAKVSPNLMAQTSAIPASTRPAEKTIRQSPTSKIASPTNGMKIGPSKKMALKVLTTRAI